MITRQDIEDEAAMVRRLIEYGNPTGGRHTPTPWKAQAVADIVDEQGHRIAIFDKPADRDLALYFANSHAGIISLLRGFAGTFDGLSMTLDDPGARDFCERQGELARIYADLFCRLGKPE